MYEKYSLHNILTIYGIHRDVLDTTLVMKMVDQNSVLQVFVIIEIF